MTGFHRHLKPFISLYDPTEREDENENIVEIFEYCPICRCIPTIGFEKNPKHIEPDTPTEGETK